MRASRSVKYNTKTGFIERIDLKIYPEELTLLASSKGGLYLLEAIRDALLNDNERALNEVKEKKTARKKK